MTYYLFCQWDGKEEIYNNLEMEFERFVSKQEVSLFGTHIRFSTKFNVFFRFKYIELIVHHIRLHLLFDAQSPFKYSQKIKMR